MPFAAPVVLVRLQSSRRFDEETHKNLDALVERFQASLVTETEHFYYLLKHNKPKVAILADNAVSLNENDDLRQLLYEYVKAGGTVILALKFAVMCAEPNLDNMFKDLGIPMWTHADSSLYGYTRDNLFLNPVMKTIFPPAAHAELGPNYKIKAVHIEGVDDRDKMYYPWAEDKGSIARVPGHNSACPSAFTKIGAGYLGYVGDFPLKYGTVKIMKAMIKKALGNPPIGTYPSKETSKSTGVSQFLGDAESSTITKDIDTDEEDFALAEGLEDLELEDDFDKM